MYVSVFECILFALNSFLVKFATKECVCLTSLLRYSVSIEINGMKDEILLLYLCLSFSFLYLCKHSNTENKKNFSHTFMINIIKIWRKIFMLILKRKLGDEKTKKKYTANNKTRFRCLRSGRVFLFSILLFHKRICVVLFFGLRCIFIFISFDICLLNGIIFFFLEDKQYILYIFFLSYFFFARGAWKQPEKR